MPEHVFKILAINPGSTSTKIGLFENESELWNDHLRHSEKELQPFAQQPITAQLDFRLRKVREALWQRRCVLSEISAFVGRGGLLRSLAGGTYTVNQAMCDDLYRARRGEHASNLGALLARSLAAEIGSQAFVVDPVSVDEWPPVARLSGLAGLDRECLSHALNSRAIAQRFAKENQRAYADTRLIIAHLGSGISISAHAHGKMVDVTNSREEGAFSTERAGGLPAMKLIDWCFAGTDDRAAIERKVFREGGIFSYLGTRDLRAIMQRIDRGDAPRPRSATLKSYGCGAESASLSTDEGGAEQATLVIEAMVYQIAKEIGAMATVLHGRVDAVLLTGGMAHETKLCDMIEERVRWIAEVYRYPGEDELAALAAGALRVLRGEEKVMEY